MSNTLAFDSKYRIGFEIPPTPPIPYSWHYDDRNLIIEEF